jgi:hypothetical protein
MRKEPRGESDMAGLIALAIFGLVVYGLWNGAKSLWHEAVGSGPTFVECSANGRDIYSGMSADGVSSGWDSKTLTEYGTGKKIRMDKSAVCLEREISKSEMEELKREGRAGTP